MSAALQRPTVAANMVAQHRPLVLTICPGLNGYRIALTGGTHFEVLGEFATLDEAAAAYRRARKAPSCR